MRLPSGSLCEPHACPIRRSGPDEIDTGASPLFRQGVCVIHVCIDRSTTDTLRIDAAARKMDRQLVAMGEGIPLVMMRGAEAELLVVGNGPRHI